MNIRGLLPLENGGWYDPSTRHLYSLDERRYDESGVRVVIDPDYDADRPREVIDLLDRIGEVTADNWDANADELREVLGVTIKRDTDRGWESLNNALASERADAVGRLETIARWEAPASVTYTWFVTALTDRDSGVDRRWKLAVDPFESKNDAARWLRARLDRGAQ